MSHRREIIAYFDGATYLANPGPMGIGVVLQLAKSDGNPETLERVSRFLGDGTSNVAEWLALVEALELAVKHRAEVAIVRGDSQLVVRQLTGEYRVKQQHLMPHLLRAQHLAKQIPGGIWPEWIRREENTEADRLSKAAFDQLAAG